MTTTTTRTVVASTYGRRYLFLFIAILVRLTSALLNPVSDCDETYNYWEPTAFLINNHGFQTWEYAPQFALRSYAYLMPQFLLGKLFHFVPIIQQQPFLIFYAVRVMLSMTCLACEWFFCQSVLTWFGPQTSWLCFLFMTLSSGMFNACSAYLPQQFVLCMVLLSFGCLFREQRMAAVFWMGLAGILGWPFIAILAVPMALDCVLHFGVLIFTGYVAVIGGVLCAICIGVDYIFYGRYLLAPLNIFLYNLAISGGSGGQNLYGVDDWVFYVKNLCFNWNAVFLLALVAPLATNVFPLLFCNRKKVSKHRRQSAQSQSNSVSVVRTLQLMLSVRAGDNSMIVKRLLHCIAPFWIWYLFLTYMPHKEERFMFVLYPFIALNAALSVTQFRMFKLKMKSNRNMLKNLIVVVFAVVCAARSLGQIVYYRAPLQIWYRAGEHIRNSGDSARKNVCVGTEWYRVPSSLFVSDVADIKWIDAGFDGQLPAAFEATSVTHQPFNDQNKGHPSRFVSNVPVECDYIVDLWETDAVIQSYDVNQYEVVQRMPFLDRTATQSGIFRSLYIPMLSDMRVVYADYVFLQRKYN